MEPKYERFSVWLGQGRLWDYQTKGWNRDMNTPIDTGIITREMDFDKSSVKTSIKETHIKELGIGGGSEGYRKG